MQIRLIKLGVLAAVISTRLTLVPNRSTAEPCEVKGASAVHLGMTYAAFVLAETPNEYLAVATINETYGR